MVRKKTRKKAPSKRAKASSEKSVVNEIVFEYELATHEKKFGMTIYLLCLVFLILAAITFQQGAEILMWFLLYSVVIFTAYQAFDNLREILHQNHPRYHTLWLFIVLVIPFFGAFAYYIANQYYD